MLRSVHEASNDVIWSEGFSYTESCISSFLQAIADDFSAIEPDIGFCFIVQPLKKRSPDGRNWAVAGTVTTPWKAPHWSAYQTALERIYRIAPIIDWHA